MALTPTIYLREQNLVVKKNMFFKKLVLAGIQTKYKKTYKVNLFYGFSKGGLSNYHFTF